MRLNIIFKLAIFLILSLLCISFSNTSNIKIFCDNYFYKSFIQNKNFSKKINICDFNNINYCLNSKTKFILIDIYSYNITETIKNNKYFITSFVLDLDIKKLEYITEKFHLPKSQTCIFTTHLKSSKIKTIYVNDISSLPYIFDKNIKYCKFILGIKDRFIFNYFTTNFLLKKIISSRKIFIGFKPYFLSIGAKYIYYIDKRKYIESVINFLEKYSKHNIMTKEKIIYPSINLIVLRFQ